MKRYMIRALIKKNTGRIVTFNHELRAKDHAEAKRVMENAAKLVGWTIEALTIHEASIYV